MFSRLSRVLLTGALTAGLLAAGAAAPPTQAATKVVNACVKKKTGEVRILTGKKKKCKKGWKKVSWNQQGSQGNTGPAGPNLVVKDGTGKTLGKLMGVLPLTVSVFIVEVDGGVYTYVSNGKVFPGSPLGGSAPVVYLNNSCTGASYMKLSASGLEEVYTGSVNGPSRFVYRVTSPTWGPILAWKYGASVLDVVAAQPLYERDQTGACVEDDPAYIGKLGVLEPVAAPADVPGPLTVG